VQLAPVLTVLTVLAMLLGFAVVALRAGLSPELTVAMCAASAAIAVRVMRAVVHRRSMGRRTAAPRERRATVGASRRNERPRSRDR
jgi:membrane protein implicated in regulation of membrane protease activity